MQYGILCLLPPAAMLIFALKTKKSFEALIFGTLVAYLIMYKAALSDPGVICCFRRSATQITSIFFFSADCSEASSSCSARQKEHLVFPTC